MKNREEAYRAFYESPEGKGLDYHKRNKSRVGRRLFVGLALLVIAAFMPIFHIEAYLYFDHLQTEEIGEWIKRSGAFVLVLSLAAEFAAIDAKDIAGIGGHIGFSPYTHSLIKAESKPSINAITIGVIIQVVMGTLITSHGDLIFKDMPIQIWILPVFAAFFTILTVVFYLYKMRPISQDRLTTGHE